jgi:hypothetical protein
MLGHSSTQIVPRYAQILDQNRLSNEEIGISPVVVNFEWNRISNRSPRRTGEEGENSRQVPGTSDASKTQSALIGTCAVKLVYFAASAKTS